MICFTGHFNFDVRGDQFSCPLFQLDPTFLLSTQDAFRQVKSESDEIDSKSIKMNDAEVCV